MFGFDTEDDDIIPKSQDQHTHELLKEPNPVDEMGAKAVLNYRLDVNTLTVDQFIRKYCK